MDTQTYLQSELAKTQRTMKVALVAMSLVLVVMIFYFQWMKAELAKVLTPESVAEFVINEARGALPGVTTQLKDNLSAEAPNVVHFVLTSAVDKVLPLVAQTFHTSLEEHSRNVSSLAEEHVDAAFAGVLKAYPTAGRPKNETAAELGERLAAHVAARLGTQLDVVGADAIKARLDKSGETLKHINQELVTMASRPGGDRQGELGKRLITTWWTFLDAGGRDASKPQVDAAGKKSAN